MAAEDTPKKTLSAIQKVLAKSPGATVDEIAAQVELDHDEVVAILDEHKVDAEGQVEYAGPGAGGGWVQ